MQALLKPATAVAGLLLAADAIMGQAFIFNGDFEAFGLKAPHAPLAFQGWENIGAAGNGGLVYNSMIAPPSGGPVAGNNYGSMQSANDPWSRIIQRVAVWPGAMFQLRGFISGCATTGSQTVRYSHRVILWDGEPDTTQLAMFEIESSTSGCPEEWVPFSLITRPASGGMVTVEWGYKKIEDSWCFVATHVDELELGIAPCCGPPPSGDWDGDGDVDQSDFGHWQACWTGAGGVIASFECSRADWDFDWDVDASDWEHFEACASGPEVPAAPECTGG